MRQLTQHMVDAPGQRLVRDMRPRSPERWREKREAATIFLDPGQKPANSRVFLNVITWIRTVPIIAGWAEIEELTAEELSRAYYGQASLDEVIRAADERTRSLFTP